MSASSKQFRLDPTGTKGNLGDYQHASRVFVNGNLALAPKAKFLYHVVFNTNPLVIQTRAFDKKTVSVLVKTVELPKFTIQTETINQYNRKKNTQVTATYQPIQVRFHDDNSNIVGDMWQAYFNYYYADSKTGAIPGSYIRNAMENSILGSFASYGYDNGSYARFFNSITIYQMSRGKYTSYELINPIITQWNHDSLDYSSSNPAEQSMTIAYEAVVYGKGSAETASGGVRGILESALGTGGIPGFGTTFYDQGKSPLVQGTGIQQTNRPELAQTRYASDSTANLSFEETVRQIENYENTRPVENTGLQQTIAQTISTGALEIGQESLSGIADISFPSNERPGSTQASQINLG
jgi:hypothetical protein